MEGAAPYRHVQVDLAPALPPWDLAPRSWTYLALHQWPRAPSLWISFADHCPRFRSPALPKYQALPPRQHYIFSAAHHAAPLCRTAQHAGRVCSLPRPPFCPLRTCHDTASPCAFIQYTVTALRQARQCDATAAARAGNVVGKAHGACTLHANKWCWSARQLRRCILLVSGSRGVVHLGQQRDGRGQGRREHGEQGTSH